MSPLIILSLTLCVELALYALHDLRCQREQGAPRSRLYSPQQRARAS